MSWGEQIFTLLVLVISAGICTHIVHGFGTKKARDMFVMLILLIIVCGQLFHLVHAATYIPATRFFIWNPLLHRDDCIGSGKGGKRIGNSTQYEDMNPCFCYGTNANCYTTVKNSNKIYDLSTEKCPFDGTAKCNQGPKHSDRIHRWVPSLRDCHGGQWAQCSKEQPCTPCERETLSTFKQGRCRTCSTQNTGECNFVQGVGPYCLVSPNSKEIEPCKTCCTEPEPYFDTAGFCW
jgi:hypothetical protein